MDPVDELILAITLLEPQLQVQLLGQCAAIALHISQRFVAIDVRLALAQKVEVRTVQDINDAAHDGLPLVVQTDG